MLVLALGCGAPGTDETATDPAPAVPPTEAVPPTPDMRPDTREMEPLVAERLEAAEAAVLANPRSAEAWGRFGMVHHAHELWDEAAEAYAKAEQLDAADVRWPYFLGDVLSVLGTDLAGAEAAFRRAMALQADYPPAHMRLGNVLVAANRPEEAARQFERALALEPGLAQARVPLAQIRLSEGDLDAAERHLDLVLAEAPRHGQALAAMGQVYMRQGRREEARAVAELARNPASYNLYSDPLMGQVVNEGASAVLIWERAKSFLENENYEQAVLGLRRVVSLMPTNAEVHLQLAVAYGGLAQLDRARYHLEQAVALDPEAVEPRVRLAGLALDTGDPRSAIPQLRKALELEPGNPEAPWLLGKALVLAGQPVDAMAVFEGAVSRGLEPPAWVRNQWGSALAQSGRPQEAMAQFRAALAADPNDAQAHFFVGLVLEGQGRVDDAVASYCRSIKSDPNPPSATRLQVLGRTCA